VSNRVSESIKVAVASEYSTTTNPDLAVKYGVKLSWLESFAAKSGLRKAGNLKHRDLQPGEKVGDLEVLRKTDKRHKNNIMYKCRCSCGAEFLVRSTNLRREITTSCSSCATRKHLGGNHHRRGGCGPIGGSIWSKIRVHAHERGIVFAITVEEAVALYENQQRRCALTGLPIEFPTRFKEVNGGTASLDRVDSSLGYTIDNVRWVHKAINMMRNKMTDDEFYGFCKAVVDHRETLAIAA
jgi:hypothetical protein